MQTLTPKDFQRVKDNCLRGLQTCFGGHHVYSFAGRYCSKAECLAILFLLHDVKNVGCHVQHWSGRKEVDTFMTWNNNLVVECKDSDTASEMFSATKLAFGDSACGWKNDNQFGLGFPATPDKENALKFISDLIIYFHSVKQEFKENIRIGKQPKTASA